MVAWFSSRNDSRRTAAELYGAVVAQARTPAFYSECGISDTPEGRYEMIVLHLALVLERLSGEGGEAAETARLVVEAFVADMDDSMREMGVGDLAVPRRVKRAAAGLYERTALYSAARDGDDGGALAARLAEHLPGLAGAPAADAKVAAYVRRVRAHLRELATGDVAAGHITFPAPGLERCGEGGGG